jgi:FkbM family methyltransferase
MGNPALRTIVTMSGRTLAFAGDEGDAGNREVDPLRGSASEFEGFIRLHLDPGANCIDVGADIGVTAALLATYCPNGRVFAFEASPRRAQRLRENIARNGLGNCAVSETAIGNRCGSVALLETAAGSHVVRAAHGHPAGARVVPVASLDSLFHPGPLGQRIDLVRLDIEGFEPAAISGAARLIERDRCTLFMTFDTWRLQALHEYNPFAFARSLAAAFDMATLAKDGRPERIAAADVKAFLHRNLQQHGGVDHVLLRLKEGARVPPLLDMVKTAEDAHNLRETARLRAELKEAQGARYFGFGRWLDREEAGGGHQPLLPMPVNLGLTRQPVAPDGSQELTRLGAHLLQDRAPQDQAGTPAAADSPAESTSLAESRNDHIQLLRAVAILLVLFAHLSIGDALLAVLPLGASNPGWIGAALFFLVSGFIVVQSFARAGFAVGPFAVRRLFRIYPLVLLFLALTGLLKLLCDATVASPPLVVSPSFATLYHQGLAILFAYHPTEPWGSSFANGALWSLSVELRFYLALGILVAVLNLISPGRLGHRRSILIAAGAVYAACIAARVLACVGVSFALGDALIAKMYDFIALGVIVAALPGSRAGAAEPGPGRAVRSTALALMAGVLVLVAAIGSPYQSRSPAAFNLAMMAVGIAFALIIAYCASAEASELSQRMRTFANFVGDRSYAIFLLHLPVFTIAWVLAQQVDLGAGSWRWPLFQLAVSVILLPPIVEIAHRWIELPMMALGRSLSERMSRIADDPLPWRQPAFSAGHGLPGAQVRLEPAE